MLLLRLLFPLVTQLLVLYICMTTCVFFLIFSLLNILDSTHEWYHIVLKMLFFKSPFPASSQHMLIFAYDLTITLLLTYFSLGFNLKHCFHFTWKIKNQKTQKRNISKFLHLPLEPKMSQIIAFTDFCFCLEEYFAVHSLSLVQLFAIPWAAAFQASLSFTISWSLLKFISISVAAHLNHCITYC